MIERHLREGGGVADGTAAATGGDPAVVALVAGDERAWRIAFDEHYPDVYRFFRSRTESAREAEELSLQVFIEAAEEIRAERSGAEMDSLPTRLFRLAGKLLGRHARRLVAAGAPTPMSPVHFIREEFLDPDLHDVLRTLPPDQRMALELRYVLGISSPGAAASMGRAVDEFEATLSRAARAFRRVTG